MLVSATDAPFGDEPGVKFVCIYVIDTKDLPEGRELMKMIIIMRVLANPVTRPFSATSRLVLVNTLTRPFSATSRLVLANTLARPFSATSRLVLVNTLTRPFTATSRLRNVAKF